MIPDQKARFVPSQDNEEMQAVVLAAAIQGDEACREELPVLSQGFEEPYRTVASVLIDLKLDGEYIDQNTALAALEGKRLIRRDPNGKTKPLTSQEAINLICAADAKPGQADAYRKLLRHQLEDKRKSEFRERAQEAVQEFGHDPDRFLREAEKLVAGSRRHTGCEFPSESLKFIPYFQELMQLRTGAEFLGLDSGFPILDSICNGLDTGLTVIAAPPSMGKTTFLWQLCQQVAVGNQVPVVFSDIARGRPRSSDPQ
jgi:replicative DNA helicase